MNTGISQTILQIFRLCNAMHPVANLNGLKHRLNFLITIALNFRLAYRWFNNPDNPLLNKVLKEHPLTSGSLYWSYINCTWPMQKRMSVIDQHYRILQKQAFIFAHATFSSIELANMHAYYPGLRLVLDKAEWFMREGEVVLNIFIEEQRIYSISFALGSEDNKTVLIIGAIQGSNIEAVQATYRDITHALHGLRPRDLLMFAIKSLCNNFAIDQIWAISNQHQQHNSEYFGKPATREIFSNYDEVWIEHGGNKMENGFYKIPTPIKHKDLSEIPSRKRSAYRRRYQMLDQLAIEIQDVCNKYEKMPVLLDSTSQQKTNYTVMPQRSNLLQ